MPWRRPHVGAGRLHGGFATPTRLLGFGTVVDGEFTFPNRLRELNIRN
ncbi:hypothetical protein ACGFRG_24130 [Streptomyces sp. NPDC048696]